MAFGKQGLRIAPLEQNPPVAVTLGQRCVPAEDLELHELQVHPGHSPSHGSAPVL